MSINLFHVIKGVVHVEGPAAPKAVYWMLPKTRYIAERH